MWGRGLSLSPDGLGEVKEGEICLQKFRVYKDLGPLRSQRNPLGPLHSQGNAPREKGTTNLWCPPQHRRSRVNL